MSQADAAEIPPDIRPPPRQTITPFASGVQHAHHTHTLTSLSRTDCHA